MIDEIYPRWTIYPHLKRLMWNTWPSDVSMEHVKCPVLVMTGAEDVCRTFRVLLSSM